MTATDTNIGQPAIPAIQPKFLAPKMYSETPPQLVAHFVHPNGWWRDMAQRLLVLKQDKSVVPALQQMARSSDNLLARFHALWTLEGLGALDATLVREGMKDKNPRMRVQAIRASETLYKAGDKSLADDYRALTKDTDQDVVIQAMYGKSFQAVGRGRIDQGSADCEQNPGRGAHRRTSAGAGAKFWRRPSRPDHADEEKRLQQGNDVFGAVCFACHGTDGMGKALEGAAPGTMMAPPLVGSPRLQGHRDW